MNVQTLQLTVSIQNTRNRISPLQFFGDINVRLRRWYHGQDAPEEGTLK
jgi:hypothetical protein